MKFDETQLHLNGLFEVRDCLFVHLRFDVKGGQTFERVNIGRKVTMTLCPGKVRQKNLI